MYADYLKKNEELKNEFIENFAQKIYELRPYGYNDVPTSCETEYVKWENVSDKERYINLTRNFFKEHEHFMFNKLFLSIVPYPNTNGETEIKDSCL